jgi:hypothetical protein
MINNIDSMQLLNIFLVKCHQITNDMALKAQSGQCTSWDVMVVKMLKENCLTITVIYFYRNGLSLDTVMSQAISEKSVEISIKEKWKLLEKLNDREIAELTIDALQQSSAIMEVI